MRSAAALLSLGFALHLSPAAAQDRGVAPVRSSSPYGMCCGITRPPDFRTARRQLELMREAGVGWIRVDFDWKHVEPKPGKWEFDHLDRVLDLAEAKGIEVLAILDYDVLWARPAHRNLPAWLGYVKRVVERYAERVRYWEVWNEQNAEWFWPSPSPRDYATFLQATAKTIRETSPRAQVVFGGLYEIDVEFVRGVLDAGAGDAFDVMSVHPYESHSYNLQNALAPLTSLLRERGLEKPLWITEYGWDSPGFEDWQQRENSIGLAIALNLAQQGTAEKVFWYNLRSGGGGEGKSMGLLRQNLKRNPIYHAYQAVTRARPAGSVRLDEDDTWWNESFTWPHWRLPDGRHGWAVWANAPAKREVRLYLGGDVDEVFDVFGKTVRLRLRDGLTTTELRDRAPIYVIGPHTLAVEFAD